MTKTEEIAFEAKAEKHFKSHQPCPNGRNNWAWELRKNIIADNNFKNNFDRIFPNAPCFGV